MAFVIASGKQGSLPLTFPFTSPVVGPATLVVAATAWTKTAATLIGVEVVLNNVVLGTLQIYANLASVHITLPTALFNANFGSQTGNKLTLQAATGTTVTDVNDYFSAWILD
jgi:hypothetical protein